MPEFSTNEDGSNIIKNLITLFKYYPLEIQLVWLAELLVCIAYKSQYSNVNNCKVIRLNKERNVYVLTQDGAKTILLGQCNPKWLTKLFDFRNNFVHNGSLIALSNLRNLQANFNEIDKLATFAEVTLNWNCCLTDILVPDEITGEKQNG